MTNNSERSKFYKLLLKNDENELKKYLISNGKSPKPICPVMFHNKEEKEKKNNG